MIGHLLLVAGREFRAITATKGFWVTLLLFPLLIAIGPVAQRFLSEADTERVMLIDRSGGGEARAIAERLRLDEARDVLTALARYARQHRLATAAPDAPWARYDRWFTDADVARFVAEGGERQALARMKPAMTADTPAFDRPEPTFTIVPTPPAVASADPARLNAALAPLLRPDSQKTTAKKLHYALYIPADFARGGAVRLWSDGPPRARLMTSLQSVLTRDLRTRYLQANGLAPMTAAAASAIAPAIIVDTPPAGGREKLLVQSVVPLAMAYVLQLALLLSGSWMLQSLIEERSNKLLEAVLACVSPNALMYGKLVGTVAVGLIMVAVWLLCGVGAAFATRGEIADMIRPALAPLSSPWIIAAIVYYFVAGYLLVSMIFLAIGGMTDSMRDAQNYLMPVTVLIVAPFAIIVPSVLQGTAGAGLTVMTWIPLFTPFTMLARLGSGVPVGEVVGTMVLLAVFIAIEFVLLGRVFRHSLLQAGQKPSLAGIGRLIRGGAPA